MPHSAGQQKKSFSVLYNYRLRSEKPFHAGPSVPRRKEKNAVEGLRMKWEEGNNKCNCFNYVRQLLDSVFEIQWGCTGVLHIASKHSLRTCAVLAIMWGPRTSQEVRFQTRLSRAELTRLLVPLLFVFAPNMAHTYLVYCVSEYNLCICVL